MTGVINMKYAALLSLLALAVNGRPQVNVQFPGGSVNVNKGLVDVQHPAGSVNVNKGLVDVQHPAGSVNVGGGVSKQSAQQADLLAILRSFLGMMSAQQQQRTAVGKEVDVAYPGGSVSVRKAATAAGRKDVDVAYPGGSVAVRRPSQTGPKQVDVAYPGGSVNVGSNGNNVDVAFPGGFVKLDPKEPGRRRNGVVVFPFGSVRFG